MKQPSPLFRNLPFIVLAVGLAGTASAQYAQPRDEHARHLEVVPDTAGRARPARPEQVELRRPAAHGHAYPAAPYYPPEPRYRPVESRYFTCESYKHQFNRCHAPPGHIVLREQLSNAACLAGRDWGVEGDTVWVSNGCRATFSADW